MKKSEDLSIQGLNNIVKHIMKKHYKHEIDDLFYKTMALRKYILEVQSSKRVSSEGVFFHCEKCNCGKKVNGKWDDCCGWRCWNKKYH